MNNENPVEILPGLYQIRLPIPIKSLGSVFAYLAIDGQDNLLIDSGWPGEESLSVLESSLDSIGLTLRDIRRVVVSHLHPDHFGLAAVVRDRAPESKLIMHRSDSEGILNTDEEYRNFIEELHQWLAMHGTPDEELDEMLQASVKMLTYFKPPRPTDVVEGGEILNVGERWKFEIISTPGHTSGNICLYDRSTSHVFFSGDHILPTITPNISLTPRRIPS